MTKKSRRARRQTTKVAQPVRISRPLEKQTAPQKVDFAKEYHYVLEDLKRIAITAASLLALLIILAIIIG